MKNLSKNKITDFVKAAIIRAIWTMAEVALSMITVGATVHEVEWVHIASVVAVAGVCSLLKSVVVGLPEIEPDILPETKE